MASSDSAGVLRRWRARLAVRRALLTAARKRHERNPTTATRDALTERKQQVAEAERVIARHTGTLRVSRPFSLRVTGYGPLGPLRWVTIHHDALAIDPAATRDAQRVRLVGYDGQHERLYGGGIGYHEAIGPDGSLWQMRGQFAKGAHTGGHNSGNYGIVLLGNFELQRPTDAQLLTLRDRLGEAPPPGLPDLRGKMVRGHQDWDGPTNATLCPGKNLVPVVRKLPGYVEGDVLA